MTQTNSKQRCKVDLIGETGLQELFNLYEREATDVFRSSCIALIDASSGKKNTKDKFINTLQSLTSKDKMLKTTTNYIMAGQGFGV